MLTVFVTQFPVLFLSCNLPFAIILLFISIKLILVIVYCISVLLVPVYFVPVVIVSAIFVNKLINRTLVSVVAMSTVLAVLHKCQ